MIRREIDKACGQTPCLCGTIDTWHPECYAGKDAKQIESMYKTAYKTARAKIERRAENTARMAIDKAMRKARSEK